MDYDRIIINFIDGKITPEEEDQMFKALSYDESLRKDFKEYQQINIASKNVANYFAPQPHVVNNIYRKLGYSIPSAQAASFLSRFFMNKRFLIGHAITALASVVLSIAVILAFFMPTNKNLNNVEKNDKGKSNTNTIAEIPITKSKENSIQNKKLVKRIQMADISHDINSNEENIVQEQTPLPQTKDTHLYYSNEEPVSNYNLLNSTEPRTNLRFNDNTFSEHPLFRTWKPIGLTLGFNGSAVWNIPAATIPSNYVSPFSNLCLSLYYDISDRFRIGAELRQESFYMEYTSIESDYLIYLYKEKANFASYSINARYYPIEKSSFNPYIGFNTGFNRGGIIARPSIGLEYQVYSDIAFVLGIEGTRFWFTHQNNWFYTSKVGINYGVLINF